MKRLTIMTALMLTLVAMAAMASLVTDEGKTPYYSDLAEAQAAAADDQFIAIEYFTDT